MMKRLISITLILLSVALLFSEESEVWKKVEICGVEMEWDGYRVKEDGSDLDPYTTLFSDIAEDHFFQEEYNGLSSICSQFLLHEKLHFPLKPNRLNLQFF